MDVFDAAGNGELPAWLLGSGSFSHVYRVTLDGERRFASLRELQHGASTLWRRLSGGPTVGVAPRAAAAKVSAPAQMWEWYLHAQMRRRLPGGDLRRMLLGSGLQIYGGAVGAVGAVPSTSVLLLPVSGPTLQQLLERRGSGLPEVLALFYTLELAKASC